MIASIKKQEKLLPVFELALGSLVRACLAEIHCEDVARNADGTLWVKYTGQDFQLIGHQSDDQAFNLIATAASLQGANVNFDRPVLETILPDGNRFQGMLPPPPPPSLSSLDSQPHKKKKKVHPPKKFWGGGNHDASTAISDHPSN